MLDLGSMANKYKNFNSLEDFNKTIDYLEEKLQSDRNHKGDLKQKIERLKSFALTYMQNLQKGSQKTTPEDLAQNGPAFLEKFGPDKNGKNYSDTAIKFKDWMSKQPKSSEKSASDEKTSSTQKFSWLDRHPWVSDAAKILAVGTVFIGASVATLNPALGIGAAAAIGAGTSVGLGIAGYGVIKTAQGISKAIEAVKDSISKRKEHKKAKPKEKEKKTKTSFFSKIKNWWKDKNHSGLKMAVQLGAVSTVMIGTSIATLNPALGIGAAAAYGLGATAAIGAAGSLVVGLAKGIENIKDRFADKKMAKVMKDIEKEQQNKQLQHEEVKRRTQEMLNSNRERKEKENKETAKIVELYPEGNPYSKEQHNAPMREGPNILIQSKINSRRQQD